MLRTSPGVSSWMVARTLPFTTSRMRPRAPAGAAGGLGGAAVGGPPGGGGRRATGGGLGAPRQGHDAWPDGRPAEMEHVDVAIARPDPAFGGRPAVREVEPLSLDSIAAARRW